VWLHGWASAMQTRDADAQAAFYADTVDRYLGQRNVSRDDVLRDRASTIHMRQGLWTVKMEKIVVEQQSDTEAQVRLLKHFIDEPDPSSGILESFVPSRLTLKRVGGDWKITSEQDLSSSTPAPAVVPIPIEPASR
jgi:ketosteroid isomerase-like protein